MTESPFLAHRLVHLVDQIDQRYRRGPQTWQPWTFSAAVRAVTGYEAIHERWIEHDDVAGI